MHPIVEGLISRIEQALGSSNLGLLRRELGICILLLQEKHSEYLFMS